MQLAACALLDVFDVRRYKIGVFGESTAMSVGALQLLIGIEPSGSYCKPTITALQHLLASTSALPDWSPCPPTTDVSAVEGCMALMIPHVHLLEPSQLCNQPDLFGAVPHSERLAVGLRVLDEFKTKHVWGSAMTRWVDNLTSGEQWLLHRHASILLHVGHLSIGSRLLLFAWHSFGGPLIHQVHWALQLLSDDHVTTLKFRGTLYESKLAPDALVSCDQSSDQQVVECLSTACLGREEVELEGHWYLLLTDKQPIRLQPDGSTMKAKLTLDGREVSVLFDVAQLQLQLQSGYRVDPVALIEIERSACGALRERSRGWLLGNEWEQKASMLRSAHGAPRCKHQLPGGELKHNTDWKLLSFAGALRQEADAILRSDAAQWKIPTTKEWKSPRKAFAPLKLPSVEVTGTTFLEAFAKWRVDHNLGEIGSRLRNGQGLLHSPAATAALRSALHSTDQPFQLLVDIVLQASSEQTQNDPAELMPMLHAVVSAVNSPADEPFVSRTNDTTSKDLKRYTGEYRDKHVSIILMISAAVTRVTRTLLDMQTETLTTGVCRLPVKVLRLLAKENQENASRQAEAAVCSTHTQLPTCMTV